MRLGLNTDLLPVADHEGEPGLDEGAEIVPQETQRLAGVPARFGQQLPGLVRVVGVISDVGADAGFAKVESGLGHVAQIVPDGLEELLPVQPVHQGLAHALVLEVWLVLVEGDADGGRAGGELEAQMRHVLHALELARRKAADEHFTRFKTRSQGLVVDKRQIDQLVQQRCASEVVGVRVVLDDLVVQILAQFERPKADARLQAPFRLAQPDVRPRAAIGVFRNLAQDVFRDYRRHRDGQEEAVAEWLGHLDADRIVVGRADAADALSLAGLELVHADDQPLDVAVAIVLAALGMPHGAQGEEHIVSGEGRAIVPGDALAQFEGNRAALKFPAFGQVRNDAAER